MLLNEVAWDLFFPCQNVFPRPGILYSSEGDARDSLSHTRVFLFKLFFFFFFLFSNFGVTSDSRSLQNTY